MGIEGRRITLHFPAVGEDRTYATDNAPLSRLRLEVGDALRTQEGERFQVDGVDDIDGLLIYSVTVAGDIRSITELELHPQIELETPKQRLLAGQTDSHAAFALRLQTCREVDRLQRSGLRGLLGTRTALLPHQLFVASEVGRRHAPRVLLADEVGLGKTIEAGMILHRQLLTGASRRALIIVPESLQYQWLVEMRRRFNLAFALFDQERLGEGQLDNPFESEQLVLCSLALFRDNALWRELALLADWDLVIVDEAHRIHAGEDGVHGDSEASVEFSFLRELSERSAGLLLLTATPEQVGQAAHFARLALLDPARFHDFEAFREEERRYRQWSDLIDALESGETPVGLPTDIDPGLPPQDKIAQLIDRYGTGRVLYRNTRSTVGNFPERVVKRRALQWEAAPRDALYPEQDLEPEHWLEDDPRVGWLVETLRELRPAKVLVICAHAATAVALEGHLQLRAGIRAAAFHEGLSLIERDRAAAWFADMDQGAQTLLCSEIGSEGRNFQFAQHLVLFDLPRHPDQLEQRIGRLDRIGQGDLITLHLPFIAGSAQEVLLRWYDEGLNSLRESCSAGDMILERFRERLQSALRGELDAGALDQLIDETAAFAARARSELREGRDRLLERSSCDPALGAALAEQISQLEEAGEVSPYLEALCDVAGIEHEEHSENCAILRRGEQERLPLFPELPEEGATVTVSRDIALVREDMLFLSWEHPWLDGAMETLLHSGLGQSAVGTISLRGVPAGSRIYECLFTATVVAPGGLQLRQYLPLSPQRIVVDGKGRDLSELLPPDKLQAVIEKLPRTTAAKVIRQLQGEIEERLRDAEALAGATFSAQRTEATAQLEASLQGEIGRLKALRKINPAVREDEIVALERQLEDGLSALSEAKLSLQALRLVVTR
jgi:ATP-dependent helicase HepA